MATYKFRVRKGFSVTLGAPNANDPRETVHDHVKDENGVVSLSMAQIEGHSHKLEPFDDAAAAALASIASRIHVGTPNQF